MILWTIQSEPAWEGLKLQGILRGASERIMDEDWRDAYAWMVRQMTHKIGPPPSPESYPIWAWFQFESARRARPDLRLAGHLPKGEAGVRIEFECSNGEALLSDFGLWHYVLNYWYLPETEADGNGFDAELARHGLSFFDSKPLADPHYHERIEKSWERIFDLDWCEDELAFPKAQKSIQATVWELNLDQVRNVKNFKAR